MTTISNPMHELLMAKVAGMTSLKSVCLLAVPPALPVALAEAGVIDEHTGISLAYVAAIVGFTLLVSHRIFKWEATLKAHTVAIDKIAKKLHELPCRANGCEPVKHKPHVKDPDTDLG